ncbi:MAG: TIGR02530 family flagellar biosynthesis protein [Bacteriovoracaceae bacterium]
MAMNNINDVLFPKTGKVQEAKSENVKSKTTTEKSDFEKAMEQTNTQDEGSLKFSSHAMKRLNDRSIKMDSDEFLKLRDALGKLKTKGGKDSLVLTSKGAYIMDVPNNTIVTAMDKSKLGENVFTKIDSTLILD